MSHRILVLGGGSIGTRHTKNLLAREAGEVMIVEPDDARRAEIGKALDVQTGSDLDEALAAFHPDIVFVCSPTALHVPQARKSVEAGAHVFIEKPLSHTMQDVMLLQESAAAKKSVIMVGCNMRFHPGPAIIKKLLDEGVIGKPFAARIVYSGYLPSWRLGQDYRKSYSASPKQGGAVLDCIHEIDLALWYFGPGTVKGSAVLPASSIGLETDGLAEILLQHDAGTLSSIHVNFIERAFRREEHVSGSEGSLTWDFAKGIVDYTGNDGTIEETWAQPEGWEPNQMYLDELDHFLDAIDRSKAPMGSLDEAVRALEIALTVRSNRP